MSWDVLILRFAGKPPADIDAINECEIADLGSADAVRKLITHALPDVDWTDLSWGIYGGMDGCSIEFSLGRGETINNIMLHVRGGGDPISAIAAFAKPQGWSALDCTTSRFLDFEKPSEAGWEAFQRYRNKIFSKDGTKES